MLQKIDQFQSFKYLALIKAFDMKMMTQAFLHDSMTENAWPNENVCLKELLLPQLWNLALLALYLE